VTDRHGQAADVSPFVRGPVRVSVPATSANLGPGFDALGLALGLWNEATIDPSGEPGSVTLCGTEAGLLNGRENLALTAMSGWPKRQVARCHPSPSSCAPTFP